MARQFAVLALIAFAIVGIASAEGNSASPAAGAAAAINPEAVASAAASLGPAADNQIIGTINGFTHGAGKGAATPAAAGPASGDPSSSLSPSDPAASGSTTLQVSTFAGVAVSAAVASFFF